MLKRVVGFAERKWRLRGGSDTFAGHYYPLYYLENIDLRSRLKGRRANSSKNLNVPQMTDTPFASPFGCRFRTHGLQSIPETWVTVRSVPNINLAA